MKKDIHFHVLFNRKSRLTKENKAPVDIMAYREGERVYFSTGISVGKHQWDDKHSIVKGNHSDFKHLNAEIQDKVERLHKIKTEHLVKGKELSLSLLKDLAERKTSDQSFFSFMEKEMETDNSVKDKTKVSHNNTLIKLRDYNKDKDLFFSEIDFNFIDGFLKHLKSEGLRMNTIYNAYKNIRRYFYIAIKRGIYEGKNPCENIEITQESSRVEFLTIEQIRSIEKKNLSKYEEKILQVRDMFLFSCFSGLRISDCIRLRPSDIKIEKGHYSLDFMTYKVNKHAVIPLPDLFVQKRKKYSKPEIILMKYYKPDSELVFPIQNEGLINSNLKIIADLCKIKLNLQFKHGRHSFGTYMASKVPIADLMDLMQHSDVKTTMVYVHLNRALIKDRLKKVDWD